MWVNQLFSALSQCVFSLWGQQIKIFKWDWTFISVCDRPLNLFFFWLLFLWEHFFPIFIQFSISISSSSSSSSSICLFCCCNFFPHIFWIFVFSSFILWFLYQSCWIYINLHISRRYGAKEINKKKFEETQQHQQQPRRNKN